MSSSSSLSSSTTSTPSLGLYFHSGLRVWALLYVGVTLLLSVVLNLNVMVHVVGVSLLMAGLFSFRLAPPPPSASHAFLGPDPRNFDGSPRKGNGAGSDDRLGVIGHRAAGEDAPENTLSAVRLAKRNGVKCVEFDVGFTKDGVAVCLHDDTLDRTTDASGRLADYTLAQLKSGVDAAAGSLYKDAYKGERIPTVEEFVQECLKLDVKMMIDLKTYEHVEESVAMIVSLYDKHPQLYEHAMVCSFFPHLIYLIRSRRPGIVCALTWRPNFIAYETYTGLLTDGRRRFPHSLPKHALAVAADVVLKWALDEFLWYFVGASAVLLHKDVLTLESVQRWRLRGVRVIAWTVNSSLQRAYLAKFLRVTTMADSLDQIPVEEYVGVPATQERS